MQSEHVLKSGIKATPYQKSFELVTGTKSQLVGFTGGNKQFSFFAMLLVYDKCDQHRCISNNDSAELASTKVKSITFENVSNTYSTFNRVKFDTSNTTTNS